MQQVSVATRGSSPAVCTLHDPNATFPTASIEAGISFDDIIAFDDADNDPEVKRICPKGKGSVQTIYDNKEFNGAKEHGVFIYINRRAFIVKPRLLHWALRQYA